MLGIYYDDPGAVVPADLRSHAGVLVGDDFAMPENLQDVHVPDGALG